MKKLGRVVGWTLVALAVVLAVGITFTIGWRPLIGPRARRLTGKTYESTPSRLARGEYLVNAVTHCMGCHSEHDWTAHDAPTLPNSLGTGQDMNLLKGLPGRVFAPNITPDPETGTGTWTDEQLARAIREGIAHDGRALFPMMPYPDFRALSDEDIAAIVVYLRSLPAIRKQRPATELIFPVKYLIRSVPRPLDAPVEEPDPSTPERRGQYLVRIAGCGDCHSPQDTHGQPLPGMDFAGGQVMEGPWGRVATANITPHPSGIPYYDLSLFTQAMRTGSVKARRLNQLMPWYAYRNMTDQDLSAVFAYLKTLKAVRHYVDNAEPPTYCKVCQRTHGGGDRN